MKKTFYSNGKLLITAEYLVLDGATALALPTKFGQNLTVEKIESNKTIIWKSYDNDQSIWYEDIILFSSIINQEHFQDNPVKNTLLKILHEAYKLNPNFLLNSNGYSISTTLTFPKNWGLGTSSTLINNIAQWLQIDAFLLLKNSFGGSGYDIACAQNNTPILYHLQNGNPVIEKVVFDPDFKQKIYFVYLNQKQSSKTAIANYRNNSKDLSLIIPKINTITDQVLKAKDITSFAKALENHENMMSEILNTKTVKQILFSDFKGTIKSLGAWGGDFVMTISEGNPSDYFKSRGFETILTYEEMIL